MFLFSVYGFIGNSIWRRHENLLRPNTVIKNPLSSGTTRDFKNYPEKELSAFEHSSRQSVFPSLRRVPGAGGYVGGIFVGASTKTGQIDHYHQK
jgi:hypothetical protein